MPITILNIAISIENSCPELASKFFFKRWGWLAERVRIVPSSITQAGVWPGWLMDEDMSDVKANFPWLVLVIC